VAPLEQADQRMPTVLAAPRVGQHLACQRDQSERAIKFAIGQQPSVEGNSEPRNCRARRRSKSSRRAPDSDSPAGFGKATSRDPR
jgi:hypothetical protein